MLSPYIYHLMFYLVKGSVNARRHRNCQSPHKLPQMDLSPPTRPSSTRSNVSNWSSHRAAQRIYLNSPLATPQYLSRPITVNHNKQRVAY
mgnify:FL=1